jgi:uncharacterized membrane protein
MSGLGAFHVGTALAALSFGAAVLLIAPKGTRRHRQLGWCYVASMLLLNVSALLIYRLFGGFGPFHVAAVLSLATVLLGTSTAIAARRSRQRRAPRDRARWVDHHYHWMTYSYVGLLAAAAAEIATRVPAFRPGPGAGPLFGIVVVVSSLAVFAIGSRVIKRRTREMLAPFRAPPSSPT